MVPTSLKMKVVIVDAPSRKSPKSPRSVTPKREKRKPSHNIRVSHHKRPKFAKGLRFAGTEADEEPDESPHSDRWYDSDGDFRIPSSQDNIFSHAEEKERRRGARRDFAGRNYEYILRLCEQLRGNFWKCQVDENATFMVGCRNYIVTLVFDDGKKWLLKTSQPDYSWSKYKYNARLLDREIASTLWLGWNTGVPVPKIQLWDIRSKTENKFGKPWYIMTMASGRTVTNQLMRDEATKRPGYVRLIEELKIACQLAKFQIDTLSLPWNKRGKLRLTEGSTSFLGGDGVQTTKLFVDKYTSDTLIDDDLQVYFNNVVTAAMDRCTKQYVAEKLTADEYDEHSTVLQEIDRAMDRLIDPRFANTYILSHQDYTTCNMLCDEDYQITAIIDWELAALIHLQLAVGQSSANRNKMFDKIPKYVDEMRDEDGDVNSGDVRERWRAYDAHRIELREAVLDEVEEKLDTSVEGDGTTVFTAGDSYITWLYYISPELMTMWDFVLDYRDFCEEDEDTRDILLTEMQWIVREANRKVNERDGEEDDEEDGEDETRMDA